jgi:GT2 family glycosyltransferase
MDKPKLIGVVTVTYNSSSVICGFMDSLLKQGAPDFVLYVIDNASSDETLKLLTGYQDPRVLVIPNGRNVGVAEGNNIGIRAALKDDCALVLLINNDTVFDSDLVAGLVEGIGRYKCDMVVPKIMYFDQPKRIWSAGGSFSRIRGSARHFGFNREDDGTFDQPRAVNYNPTCCMLIKREVFERVGMMDANYFVYFDDTDFCRRAYRSGIKLFYVPSVRLLHKVSSLTGSVSDFTIRYLTRNHVYYLLKNFPRWQVLFYLPAYQVHILVRYFLTPTKLRAFLITEKAFLEGIRLFVHSRRTVKVTSPSESQMGQPCLGKVAKPSRLE